MDPFAIINFYYPEQNALKESLLKHSMQVRDKVLQIKDLNLEKPLNEEILICGSLLHDVGIIRCNAPDIYCTGTEHYLKHGLIGAEMLRQYGKTYGIDLEPFARICERHIGSGLTADEIRSGSLPLPVRDYLPETPEEKIICLADKFYSKSGDMKEKSFEKVLRSQEKFGKGPAERFFALCREFHVVSNP